MADVKFEDVGFFKARSDSSDPGDSDPGDRAGVTLVHEVEGVVPEASRIKKLAGYIVKRIENARDHKIPMLPGIAQRAMEVANDPDVSIRDLSKVMKPDAVLTARVLSISNSPLYAPAKRITNLDSGIMLLGVGLVRDILYQSVAEAHIFRGDAAVFLRQHRLHGIAVAYIMRHMSGHLGLSKDYAFLSGLLHDIGTVVLRQVLDKDAPQGYEPSDFDFVAEQIHTHIGKLVCERWDLPASVQEVARRHHRFESGGSRDGYSQLGHVAAVSERLADHVGLGETRGMNRLDGSEMGMFYQLGLDEEAINSAISFAESIRERLKP